VVLAARGARNLDGREVPIEDAALTARLRRRARAVHLGSILTGALVAALALALPG
jgi:hypothetical protein